MCVIWRKEFSNLFRIGSSYPEQWLICWQWWILENFVRFRSSMPVSYLWRVWTAGRRAHNLHFGESWRPTFCSNELAMFHAIRKRRLAEVAYEIKLQINAFLILQHTAMSLCCTIFKSLVWHFKFSTCSCSLNFFTGSGKVSEGHRFFLKLTFVKVWISFQLPFSPILPSRVLSGSCQVIDIYSNRLLVTLLRCCCCCQGHNVIIRNPSIFCQDEPSGLGSLGFVSLSLVYRVSQLIPTLYYLLWPRYNKGDDIITRYYRMSQFRLWYFS